jgi:Helix-turn-helix domain
VKQSGFCLSGDRRKSLCQLKRAMDKIREAVQEEVEAVANAELAKALSRIADTFTLAAQSVQVENPVNIQGAAKFLGVAAQSIRNWITRPPYASNPLPRLKAGSELRFLRSELLVWMRRNVLCASADLESSASMVVESGAPFAAAIEKGKG